MPARSWIEKILVYTASIYPKRLSISKTLAETPKERRKCTLILRLHRLATENGKPCNMRRLKLPQEIVLYGAIKGLPKGKVLRLLVEASFTLVRTARNEEGDSNSLSVCYVAGMYGCVIHDTWRTRSLISCVRP